MNRFEEWTIAYRSIDKAALLLDDRAREFHIIKNTWRYWCADPHLFEHDGRTYVFAELYDRVIRRGVIGCCEITENGYTPWKVVLKMPWHLSYPHVFFYHNEIFMIPESYMRKEIAVYKAISFPEKWEKFSTLKADYITVDSTLFSVGEKNWLQTLHFSGNHECFEMFQVENGKLFEKPLVINVDDANKRPGGKLFSYRGKLVRPAQDCTQSYGCALNFYEVTKVEKDAYEEVLLTKVRPTEIRSDFLKIPQGIHTYNQSEKYEVIDLKSYEKDWLFYIVRPVWFIWRRVKKVFRK